MHLAAGPAQLPTNAPILLLQEPGGGRRTLPIYIGAAEATAIAYALQGVVTPRPMTHDLMRDLLKELGTTVASVVFTALRESTFFDEIRITYGGRQLPVPARPSDAIALGNRSGKDGTMPTPSETATVTEDGYRGPQVCTIVGITYRQLDYWARTDLLRPSISEARGSGTQRRYSYRDLLQLKVIKRLLDAGISLQSARRALDCLRSSGEDVATANLVLNGSQSVLATTGEEIIDLLKGGQGVLNIVPLPAVVTELDAAIHELSGPVSEEAPAAATPASATGG